MTASGEPLTLMVVHAHPDDEALSTGGILARYADEGIRTVLVTCTNGELGYGPGGIEPGDPAYDEAVVTATRRRELEASRRLLGIDHLELLGFHDSGMMGWPQNDASGAFWRTPVEDAAARLTAVMARYSPQVVVTYDADGFYGHPDHIQAHRVTVAAAEGTGIPDKLYFTALPRSRIPAFVQSVREAGLETPEWDEGDEPPFGTDDERVGAYIDCRRVVGRKYDSLAAHASQLDNAFFLGLGRELFGRLMAEEAFVRAADRTGSPLPEDDLFAGLR